jgi:hypothetical protein
LSEIAILDVAAGVGGRFCGASLRRAEELIDLLLI